jgi:putative transposase
MQEFRRGRHCRLLACHGEADHVHLLVEYPPKLPVSTLVNMFKGTSSRMLRQERPDIAQRYWHKGALWSPSYFAASTGGATLESVKRYVEGQRASSSRERQGFPARGFSMSGRRRLGRRRHAPPVFDADAPRTKELL